MKKKEIIREIAKKTGMEVMQTETVVESFMNTVKEELINNKTIYLRGFGSFQLKETSIKKSEDNS
jgi:DNA-binding protein HU-beta